MFKTMVAGIALAMAAAPAAAHAQAAPPVDGNTNIGGSVSSELQLVLNQPVTGSLAKFSKAKKYSLTLSARAIATDPGTTLSVVDGDATSGSKLGHMASGSKVLPLPLEASVGSAAFKPLDTSVDPLLEAWNTDPPNNPVTINLRQQVKKKASGTYHKVILVTLSAATP
jgi:hypothetical protein